MTKSPLSQPRSQTSTSRAQRIVLNHLLASRAATLQELVKRTHIPAEDLLGLLRSCADGSEAIDNQWHLSPRSFRELDVWRFPYPSSEDRTQAIQNAVRAFDKQRISPSDSIWQFLLPQKQRGKGKVLSKLNFTPGSHRGILGAKLNDRPISRPASPQSPDPAIMAGVASPAHRNVQPKPNGVVNNESNKQQSHKTNAPNPDNKLKLKSRPQESHRDSSAARSPRPSSKPVVNSSEKTSAARNTGRKRAAGEDEVGASKDSRTARSSATGTPSKKRKTEDHASEPSDQSSGSSFKTPGNLGKNAPSANVTSADKSKGNHSTNSSRTPASTVEKAQPAASTTTSEIKDTTQENRTICRQGKVATHYSPNFFGNFKSSNRSVNTSLPTPPPTVKRVLKRGSNSQGANTSASQLPPGKRRKLTQSSQGSPPPLSETVSNLSTPTGHRTSGNEAPLLNEKAAPDCSASNKTEPETHPIRVEQASSNASKHHSAHADGTNERRSEAASTASLSPFPTQIIDESSKMGVNSRKNDAQIYHHATKSAHPLSADALRPVNLLPWKTLVVALRETISEWVEKRMGADSQEHLAAEEERDLWAVHSKMNFLSKELAAHQEDDHQIMRNQIMKSIRMPTGSLASFEKKIQDLHAEDARVDEEMKPSSSPADDLRQEKARIHRDINHLHSLLVSAKRQECGDSPSPSSLSRHATFEEYRKYHKDLSDYRSFEEETRNQFDVSQIPAARLQRDDEMRRRLEERHDAIMGGFRAIMRQFKKPLKGEVRISDSKTDTQATLDNEKEAEMLKWKTKAKFLGWCFRYKKVMDHFEKHSPDEMVAFWDELEGLKSDQMAVARAYALHFGQKERAMLQDVDSEDVEVDLEAILQIG